ncbi:hypothetical protein BE21_19830 [Sorangium cellulosum]|uniref:DUF4276 family protein n=1 Tax=Sorangium cellulosum TaxID=56 RepID=A0A150TWI4_SORCE|nr:hypothetical protein BE21_19830 [Sorangium cellulosum]
MKRRKKPAYTVFIAAEGPSEIGDLACEPTWRKNPPREGYFQPMLRRLLGENVAFDGQRITLLGRFEEKKKLKGHADRAAKALALASTVVEGCRVVVFVHDADKASSEKRNATERTRRVRMLHDEIDTGFAAVEGADHVLRVKATPLRMIEAWALGDKAAVVRVAGKGGDSSAVPGHPEETWGDEKDRASGHPKCVLRRALGRDPSAQDFADLAAEADLTVLRASCPTSFAPFVEEAETAGKEAVVAGVMEQ